MRSMGEKRERGKIISSLGCRTKKEGRKPSCVSGRLGENLLHASCTVISRALWPEKKQKQQGYLHIKPDEKQQGTVEKGGKVSGAGLRCALRARYLFLLGLKQIGKGGGGGAKRRERGEKKKRKKMF